MSRSDAVDRHSAKALRLGSGSFAAAARMFGPAMRRDAELLYAWCRHCDDVIDGQVLGQGRVETDADAATRLRRLEDLTRAALAGEPVADPAFVAFGRVAKRRRIPERYPLDLLQGFRMDVEARRYETLDDVLGYAYHVAGVVGLMMAIVMGVAPDDEATLDRACDLGLAFQLTNIARDVVEDAERGRLYLPQVWLREAGLHPDRIDDPAARRILHRLAVRLLDVAEAYYASAGAGLPRLPWRAAMAIGAARSVYRGIGTKLRRQEPDTWARRVSVTRWRKLAFVGTGASAGLLAKSLAGRQTSRRGLWLRPGRDAAASA